MYDMDKEYVIIPLSDLTNGAVDVIGSSLKIPTNYERVSKIIEGREFHFITDESMQDYRDKVVDMILLDKDQFVEDYMKAKQNELKNSK